ncbi:MAG: YgjV family protein [Clostridiales bacterium]|nr:YgjV family protein [Clostridiales bacterium]
MHITIFGTSVNWLAQLFDIIGFIVFIFAYQQKKNRFVAVSIIAYLFFILESLSILLIDNVNTWANIIGTASGIVRNIFMLYFAIKKDKEVPMWIALVILAATWGLNVPFFEAWYTYIPCVALTICSITAVQKNYYILKVGAMVNEAAFIVYNFAVGGYAGVVREIILVLVIAYSMVVMAVKEGKIKLPSFAAIKLKMQYTIEDTFYRIYEHEHMKHVAHRLAHHKA